MTDNEIIKALELCVTNDYFEQNCKDCSFKKHGAVCMDVMLKYVLDLINRQKAEIEHLKNIRNEKAFFLAEDIKNEVKANAIKEFAERLKAIYNDDSRYDRPNAHTLIVKLFANIDDLVKEMVGVDNG